MIYFFNKYKGLQNIIALTGIQGTNAIIPVALFPYFMSVLGATLFAKLAVLEVVALYVLTISLFSFETFGVQKILQCSNNTENEVGRLFFRIFALRLLLFAISTAFITIVFWIFFREEIVFLFIWLMLPLGQIFQCSYFYQAVGRNQENALIMVPCRLLAIAAGYSLVAGPEDVVYAHIIIPLSYLLSGVISFILCLRIVGEVRDPFNQREIFRLFREGWVLFVGSLAVVLYRNSNVLLMTVVTHNPLAISTYAVAEKMVKMLQAMFGPINSALFPRLLSKLRRDGNKPGLTILKFTSPQLIAALTVIVGIDILAYIDSLNGELIFNKKTLELFLIMSLAPVFGICNFMFGVVGLSAINRSGSFARGTLIAGISSVILCLIGTRLFLGYGAALSFLLAEVILFCYVIFAISKA